MKRTFTKNAMLIIYVIFALGAILGAILCVWSASASVALGMPIDSGMFMAYAAYLGTPTAVAIGFYAWKSKAENLLKIKASQPLDTAQQLVDTLSQMGGQT